MKNFEICSIMDDTYLVFSVNYRSPLEFIHEIEIELFSAPPCQKVIFDLLLSNGMTSNRYFEAFFDGSRLVNIKKCNSVDKKIKEASNCFYNSRPLLLDNSVLVNPQKFLARAGC